MTNTLKVKRYKQNGPLAHEYNALRVLKKTNGELTELSTTELPASAEHPIDLQCQPSYDGTVNLILNDDLNPPRIINTRFTKLEDNQYKIISRNQYKQTNVYQENAVDMQTRLFRNISYIPKIDLVNIYSSGQLMGGNYTVYIKYADSDYNKTDVVAESGMISVFLGNLNDPKTVSGALADQRTDKSISMCLRNLDTSFAYFYVYFRRNTSDTDGFPINTVYMVNTPFKIKSSTEYFTLNGYEETSVVDEEELNIKYNTCTAVKTQAQVQNMLFFGNVQQTVVDNKELQNLSYFIEATCINKTESIGYLDGDYHPYDDDDLGQIEYYNPLQIYYSLGYWPEELYRFGVVYIFNDDSLSPVYPLRGTKFDKVDQSNFTYGSNKDYSVLKNPEGKINYLPKDLLLTDKYLNNTGGIFQMPDYADSNIYQATSNLDSAKKSIHPLGMKFKVHKDVLEELQKHKVKGLFFVRQQRVPITYAQGLSVGIDGTSFIPMLYVSDSVSGKSQYYYESFLTNKKQLLTDFIARWKTSDIVQSNGLLCLDAMLNPQLQAILDGSEFHLEPKVSTSIYQEGSTRQFCALPNITSAPHKTYINSKLVYIPKDCQLRYIDKYGFSTKVGSSMEAKQFGFVGGKDTKKDAHNFVRGNFVPYIGAQNKLLDSHIYSIKIPNYSEAYIEEYFKARNNDSSPFYSCSPRFDLLNTYSDNKGNIKYVDPELTYTNDYLTFPEVYRGDCYTNTVTLRMASNFIDADVPVNDLIIDINTWRSNYKGYDKTSQEDWNKINRADVNTVPIGHWVTFKCLSSYNLGLRSEDRRDTSEMSLMGNPKSFYPLQGLNIAPSGKVSESDLYNMGYTSTTPYKRYSIAPDVPYIKDVFDTRIMFSDINVEDSFRNSYRIFQGLAYKDIEKQYGAIVKLLPFGQNLFCVFERGCAIVPINEKALLSTTTGQSIHLYGAGVLQSQVTVVSPDYGSIWKESIIKTPNAIYGVDSVAKKIWKYSQTEGFVCISDQRVQRFLNDNIELSEVDLNPIIACRNIKTHYNNYKGDVMFTFYNEGKVWNLCYNERIGAFVTKYSWTPCYSENVDNIFYSMDQQRAELLGILWNNQNGMGLKLSKYDSKTLKENWSSNGNIWNNFESNNYSNILEYHGYAWDANFDMSIKSLTTSIYKDSKETILVYKPNENGKILNEKGKEIASLNKVTHKLILYSEHLKDNFYFKLEIGIVPYIIDDKGNKVYDSPIYDKIVILKNHKLLESFIEGEDNKTPREKYNLLMQNGFFVHGQAGVFDEINNLDLSQENNITPTKWYNKQEPFEFEFVVNSPNGFHKIFDNLVIISNNVEPNSMEIELIGDVYGFDKTKLFIDSAEKEKVLPKRDLVDNKYYNTDITWDNVLNQYKLKVHQDFLNVAKYGRRIGNIQYVEDSWKAVIQPIYYRGYNQTRSAKLRDKWAKIRIKYSGEKLAVILAIQTLITISYS